jgi:3-methyladenine DNA glycosylase AlkD
LDIERAFVEARSDLRRHARPDAAAQKAYLKVPYKLIGHRVPEMRAVAKATRKAGSHPPHDDLVAALNATWRSDIYEDKLLAIILAGYHESQLTRADVRDVFLQWAQELVGWSLLDGLAIDVMGRIALREPDLFKDSLAWLAEPSFWTRRAALLIHLPAIRGHELRFKILQQAAETLIGEREFFITKALGWVLRELFDRMPDEAETLFLGVGGRAAALTRREALRKLDPANRARLLAAADARSTR